MPDDQKDPPMPDDQKDPLEGFQITDYDPETEFVTIQIHDQSWAMRANVKRSRRRQLRSLKAAQASGASTSSPVNKLFIGGVENPLPLASGNG